MSRRNIDQRRKERILAEINQVCDEAYELESSCIIAWMPLPEPYKAGEEE